MHISCSSFLKFFLQIAIFRFFLDILLYLALYFHCSSLLSSFLLTFLIFIHLPSLSSLSYYYFFFGSCQKFPPFSLIHSLHFFFHIVTNDFQFTPTFSSGIFIFSQPFFFIFIHIDFLSTCFSPFILT